MYTLAKIWPGILRGENAVQLMKYTKEYILEREISRLFSLLLRWDERGYSSKSSEFGTWN